MQVLVGPAVVVCPAGELVHQLRRGYRCSQRRGGHAIPQRFQRIINPFHRAGEGQMPLMRHADTVSRQEIVGQVAVASAQEYGELDGGMHPGPPLPGVASGQPLLISQARRSWPSQASTVS